MNRLLLFALALVGVMVLALGCSSAGQNPIFPQDSAAATNGLSAAREGTSEIGQAHLWGYYDVTIDVENQVVDAVVNRGVMFAANIVNFLNNNPANLKFKINGTPSVPGGVDVDLDVTITHPFASLPQYNGYDVRGILMGHGSGVLAYNTDLKYPKLGTDQYLLDDPVNLDGGGADGYTRWFNKSEFTIKGLFGYTPGKFASPGYEPTATLCPYKYFADGLGAADSVTEWLGGTAGLGSHGVFSSGAVNTRNYYIRFPVPTPGVKFAYAVVANWKGEAPEMHPANAPEAVASRITVTPDLYYVDDTDKGGSIKTEVGLYGWGAQPSTIFIESTVLLNPYEASGSQMVPIGGGENYSTYSIEVPGDNITTTSGNEFWIVAQYNSLDYTNSFGVPNNANTDKLAAFFRADLPVASKPFSKIQVTDPNGGESLIVGVPYTLKWTSYQLSGNVKIEASIDGGATYPFTIIASTPNTGSYSVTPIPAFATTQARIKVSAVANPSVFDTSDANFSIINASITVIIPNGGQTWYAGQSYSITWGSSSLTGNVKIELSKDGGSTWPTVIAANTANDGTEIWTPAAGDVSTQAQIKISSVSYPSIFDTSNANFTVALPTITVTYPNTAVTEYVGRPFNITWTSVGLTGNVKIDLSTNGGSTFPITLFASTPNDGTESYTPLAAHLSTQCRIRVSSVTVPTIFDDSNVNFTIANPTITVTYPNTAVTRYVGTAFNITWSSVGLTGNVRIQLSTNGGSTWGFELFASTPNDGTESWTPLAAHVSSQCRIRVSSVAIPTILDDSDVNFIIANPTITVTAPNGGESWTAGTLYNITWTHVGLTGNVSIALSLNGGSTYPITIVSSTPVGTGSYGWTPDPSHVSTTARVRVTSLSVPAATDTSNSNFSIVAGLGPKDIPLRPKDDVYVMDISADSSTGDLMIYYSDGRIDRQTASSSWQDYKEFAVSGSDYGRLDMNVSGNGPYTGIGGDMWFQQVLDPNGSFWADGGQDMYVMDVATFLKTGAAYDFYITFVLGMDDRTTWEVWGPDWYMPTERFTFYGGGDTGPDQVYWGWITGAECLWASANWNAQYDHVWILEGEPDFYAARWYGEGDKLIYDGHYCGSGQQDDEKNSFYYPMDIAADTKGRIHVLDWLSNDAVAIKVFSYTGSDQYMSSSMYANNFKALPLRIDIAGDGTGYMNYSFVVYYNLSTGKCFLNVYLPVEQG